MEEGPAWPGYPPAIPVIPSTCSGMLHRRLNTQPPGNEDPYRLNFDNYRKHYDALDESEEAKKRRLRTNFTEEQSLILEKAFLASHYPDQNSKRAMAINLEIPEDRITVWFQNRRAKWRRKEIKDKDGYRRYHTVGYHPDLPLAYPFGTYQDLQEMQMQQQMRQHQPPMHHHEMPPPAQSHEQHLHEQQMAQHPPELEPELPDQPPALQAEAPVQEINEHEARQAHHLQQAHPAPIFDHHVLNLAALQTNPNPPVHLYAPCVAVMESLHPNSHQLPTHLEDMASTSSSHQTSVTTQHQMLQSYCPLTNENLTYAYFPPPL
ncbi:unnamed protein product, partial [Mesorhabditis spiculigera]